MAGRARFTEVAPAHKPLKRKRLSSVAIPMQLANALPDSFLYARLSQFEKRIDATMSEKLTRIQERVNQSEEGTHSVHKGKYRIHLYFATENNNNAGKQQQHQEQHLGSQGQGPDQPLVQETTGDKGKGKGQVLLIYGKVERCGAPKPKANASVEFTSPALKAFFAEGDKGAAADMKVSAIGKKLSACLIETQKPKIKCIVPKGSESPDVVSLSFVADVEIDNKPAREKRINLVAAVGSTSVAIEEIDRDIRKLVEEIIQRKTRRNFFTGFSQSPVDFVSSLVDSQKRDLVVCECARDYFVESHNTLRTTNMF